MGEVNVIINNQKIVAEAGETILDAARRANIRIPTLCYLKDVVKSGACRVCLVEVKGARALLSACTTPVSEGMVVWTNSERAIRASPREWSYGPTPSARSAHAKPRLS